MIRYHFSSNDKLKIIGVEIDREAILHLQCKFSKEISDNKLVLHQGNILELHIGDLCKCKVDIVASLPYNRGTTMLISWLSKLQHINLIVVMLQEEVVDRLTASCGTKEYGRLSVLVQSMCTVKKIMRVHPDNFKPIPKVMSAIVEIVPKIDKISDADFAILSKLCTAGFNTRRKTLLNCIKLHCNPSEDDLKIVIDSIPQKNIRIESLTPKEIISLARKIKHIL